MASAYSVRRMIRLGALSLGSVLLTLAGIEVIGRLVITPLLIRQSDNRTLKLQLANPTNLGVVSLYVPHHYYLYSTRPSYLSADGKIRHNSRGCRAEEVAIAKPPRVFRIVAVGASTTYSTLVLENEKVYSYRLQTLLNDWAARTGIPRSFEVLNCGVPGFSSAENLSRYIFTLSEYQPDLLILQHGIADTIPRSLPRLSRDFREFSKTWELTDPSRDTWFLRRFARAVRYRFADSVWSQGIYYVVRRPFWDKKASEVDPKNYVINGPWVFEANTRYLIRIAGADGARVLLMTEHLVPDPNDQSIDWLSEGGIAAALQHNQVITRLASQEKTLFVDLQAKLCACRALMPDGRHLNEEGEERKALAIFEVLRRELPARLVRAPGPRGRQLGMPGTYRPGHESSVLAGIGPDHPRGGTAGTGRRSSAPDPNRSPSGTPE